MSKFSSTKRLRDWLWSHACGPRRSVNELEPICPRLFTALTLGGFGVNTVEQGSNIDPSFFFYLSRTRMEKPWRSPPANGGPSSSASAALPMQMTSSTPLHFSPGITVSPASSTRMSLDLFHKNAFKYHMEQPSRPSLTTGWFSFSLWEKELAFTNFP